MKIRTGVLAAIVAGGVIALPAAGHGQAHLGPQVSLAEDADVGIGGRVVANLSDFAGWEAIGSFDVFFPDGDVDYWELNGNVVYNLPVEPTRTFFPYLGGGLNVARFDGRNGGNTELGLNVVGGGKFDATGVTPFVEARIEIEGGDQFILTGGLLFP